MKTEVTTRKGPEVSVGHVMTPGDRGKSDNDPIRDSRHPKDVEWNITEEETTVS